MYNYRKNKLNSSRRVNSNREHLNCGYQKVSEAKTKMLRYIYKEIWNILNENGIELEYDFNLDNLMEFIGERTIRIEFGEVFYPNGDYFIFTKAVPSLNYAELTQYATECANAVLDGINSGKLVIPDDIDEFYESVVGSNRLNSSRQLPYQAISIPVILRDWTTLNDGDYFSRKHQKLVDIGDTLYNDGMEMAEYLKPEYKELYEEFGEAFWKKVIEDAAAIDSQMSREKVEELDQEYTDLSFRIM